MIEWMAGLIARFGYAGVAALMVLETVFPPIPSELIMPLAGFAASQGEMTVWGVALAGTLGAYVGALPFYFAGRALGRDRIRRFADAHGRWLLLNGADVDKAADWFSRHGRAAVLLGRLVPGVRTWISVPAGAAGMSFVEFSAWSLAGIAIWTSLLAGAGVALEANYARVGRWLEPVAIGVLVALAGGYLWAVLRRKPDA